MNALSFGVKRSKFKVTVVFSMLENALFGLVICDILKITGLNFTRPRLSALMHFEIRMNALMGSKVKVTAWPRIHRVEVYRARRCASSSNF